MLIFKETEVGKKESKGKGKGTKRGKRNLEENAMKAQIKDHRESFFVYWISSAEQ